MFGSLKAYLYGGLAVIMAGLAIALKIVFGQRNKAREAAERKARKAKEVEEQRKQELAIHTAKERAEKRRREHARAEKKRIDNDVRPTDWGDSRLRDKD